LPDANAKPDLRQPDLPPGSLDWSGKITCAWAELFRELPHNPLAYLGAIVALRKLGLTADAEYMAKASSGMFPQSAQLAFEYCRAADRREAWTESAERWSAAQGAFAGHPAPVVGRSIALQRLGRLDEAETCLAAAMQRFASNFDDAVRDGWIKGLAVQSARCATSRGDWQSAIDRWKRLHDRFPAEDGIRNLYKDSIMAMNMAHAVRAAEQAGGGPARQKLDGSTRFGSAASSGLSQQDLMLRFVSLGGCCEFALVQRHFGVEPLGLLRWGNIDVSTLIVMLENKCAGVGDVDQMRLSVDPAQDYIVTDTRYAMGLHTFTHVAGQDENRLMCYLSRYLKLMREGLLEDLTSVERPFVYRSLTGMTEADMLRLSAAIRAYNAQNALLCVTIPGSGEAPATVRRLSSHVVVAALPPGRTAPPELAWKIQYEAWAHICAAAFEVFRSGS
jgi:tetratricopeptide (TPR) repeat protein